MKQYDATKPIENWPKPINFKPKKKKKKPIKNSKNFKTSKKLLNLPHSQITLTKKLFQSSSGANGGHNNDKILTKTNSAEKKIKSRKITRKKLRLIKSYQVHLNLKTQTQKRHKAKSGH